MLLLLFQFDANQIINHSANNNLLFKESMLYRDHLFFLKQFCEEAPEDIKIDLEKRTIYYRVYVLLNQLNEVLEKPNFQMIINYENIHYRYKVLIGICAMKYTVSITHNKLVEIDYVTLSASFEPKIKTNYVRNVHRIIGRLDSYSGKNDPKIYSDARDKYFKELLKKYDEL